MRHGKMVSFPISPI